MVMTHKCRGSIVAFSISRSVDPNKEQKVLTSEFEQGLTVNTARQLCRVFCNDKQKSKRISKIKDNKVQQVAQSF